MNTFRITLLTLLALPLAVQAHPEHGGNGFSSGFLHPFFGLDHLLVMVGVGLLAVRMGGRAVGWLPGGFILGMMLGGLAGVFLSPFPFMESAIALSVILVGVALAWNPRLPVLPVAVAVAGMAVFHGCAHGAEMPAMSNGALYGIGFILGTALLHATGLFVGTHETKRVHAPAVLRVAALMMACFGLVQLVG